MSDRAAELTDTRAGGLIPPGEPETVQQLIAREVANVLALYKADIDLQYRVQSVSPQGARSPHRLLPDS